MEKPITLKITPAPNACSARSTMSSHQISSVNSSSASSTEPPMPWLSKVSTSRVPESS